MTAIRISVLNLDYCRKLTLSFYLKIGLTCTLASESCATLDNPLF